MQCPVKGMRTLLMPLAAGGCFSVGIDPACHSQAAPSPGSQIIALAALVPLLLAQGDGGWDILRALATVKQEAQASGNEASFKAAAAVEARVNEVRGPEMQILFHFKVIARDPGEPAARPGLQTFTCYGCVLQPFGE
jgi:hypothetical protein